MEIGDLFVLVMIAVGVLSSLFGKKPQQTRRPAAKPPRPGPRVERGREDPEQGAERAREAKPTPAARSDVLSHMEQILQELQLAPPTEEPAVVVDPKPSPEPRTEPEVARARVTPPLPPPASPPSAPRRAESPGKIPEPKLPDSAPVGLDTVPKDYNVYRDREHREFHDRYVRTSRAPGGARSSGTRVRHFLKQHGLRGAVLASEILGPPKGLQ